MIIYYALAILISIILTFIFLYKYKKNRVIYVFGISLTFSLILGRFACASVKCFLNLPNYLYQKYIVYGNPIPIGCSNCSTDWSLREGVDESGLILFGFLCTLIILLIKNEDISLLLKKVTKLSFFGGVELENLNEKVDNYTNLNTLNLSTEMDTILNKQDNEIILNEDVPEKKLYIIVGLIEKRLKEIYSTKFPNDGGFPISINKIVDALSYSDYLDKELTIILKDFLNLRDKNIITHSGKNTLGLIEIGRKILKVLSEFIKRLFLSKRHFYGKINDVKFDRTHLDKVSLDSIVVSTTISISDDNNNYFPIEKLAMEHFSLKEQLGGIENNIPIIKIEQIHDSQTRFGIVIALDCSSSMNNDDKLIKSKEAINILLKSLTMYDALHTEVLILTFGNNKVEYLDNKWFNLKKDIDYILGKVEDIEANGNTPLLDALNIVHELFSKEGTNNRNNIIICLSDGENNVNKALESKVIDQVKLLKLPLITIGFGNGNYDYLKHLSELSGAGNMGVGYFIGVHPHELSGIFNVIIQSITYAYRIYWKPSFSTLNAQIKAILTISFKTHHNEIKENKTIITYKLQK